MALSLGKHWMGSPVMLSVAVMFGAAMSGCSTQPKPLYNWGNYQQQVYAHLKGGGSADQQIAELEKGLQKSMKSNSKIPPGYHAHLGLLYGEVGRVDNMKREFEAEKALFPESAQFMNFLLDKIAKSQGEKK